MVEAEFFGRDLPIPQFRDRHCQEGRKIHGLTVEPHLARVREGLIPLAERCGQIMREALAALEALRAAPSATVERSKPISFTIRWYEARCGGPGGAGSAASNRGSTEYRSRGADR